MWKRSLVLTWIASSSILFCIAGEGGKTVFFIQQDIRQNINYIEYYDGMGKAVKSLPPDGPLEVYVSQINGYTKAYSGEAGKFADLPKAVPFHLTNPATTPFKNLLKFLKENKVENQGVVFVTNGVSQDMFMLMDNSDMPGMMAFTPDKYPPIPELVTYCKKNGVKLTGVFVKDPRSPSRGLQDLAFSAFLYVVNSSGGQAYYNYTSFTGVFDAIFKKR